MKTTNYLVSISDTEQTNKKIEQYLLGAGLMEEQDLGSRIIQCKKFPILFTKMQTKNAVQGVLSGDLAGAIDEFSNIARYLFAASGDYRLSCDTDNNADGIVRYVRDGELNYPVKFQLDDGEPTEKNLDFDTKGTLKESYPVGFFDERELENDGVLNGIVDQLIGISNAMYYNSFKYKQKYPRG